MLKKLDTVEEKYEELTTILSDPKIASDHQQYQKYSKERSDIEDVVHRYREYKDMLRQIREAEEISQDKKAEPELREMAEGELKDLLPASAQMEQELRLMLIPRDPRDAKNIFLEVS